MWEAKNRQVKSSIDRGDSLLLEKLFMCNNQLRFFCWGFLWFFYRFSSEKAHTSSMVVETCNTFLLLEGRRSEIRKRGKEFTNGLNSVGRRRPSLSYYHPKKGHFH